MRNFKILALFCACTDRFVLDLFRNHIVGFPMKRLISCMVMENFIVISKSMSKDLSLECMTNWMMSSIVKVFSF